MLFGPDDKPNFVPPTRCASGDESPGAFALGAAIIYLGVSLLARSGERPSLDRSRGLALAPERVCRAPALPPAEMSSSPMDIGPHRITFHFSSTTLAYRRLV